MFKKSMMSLMLSGIIALGFVSTGFSQIAPRTPKPVKSQSDISQTVAKRPPTTIETIDQNVAEALTLIQQNHVDGSRIDYNEIFKSSIDGMLHTLDPHSNYFDAKEAEQFRNDQSSQYFGIGATIGDLRDADGKVLATFIKATFDGSPAHRAGLRYGDRIVEVNGTSMVGKRFSEVRSFLRGPRGTLAKITIERFATGARETVDIIRDAVPQPSIPEAYIIRPGVGYIAMTGGFNQTTYMEFRESMQALKRQGMQNLILDLRNNGGGLVSQAYRVANTFLSRGQTIFTQKGRLEDSFGVFRAENPNPDETPIVVLVNRYTASASEILAGALQDHDRALIVGETTFGKGLVQNPFQLEYNSMLLLTIAKYETPAGRLIQRDYSNGDLYNYYSNGGTLRDENQPSTPKGAESKTASGRLVYGGGGIAPDFGIRPATITAERARIQEKLTDPIFAFALDTSVGRTKGFENLKIDAPIKFDHDITQKDFPITEELFQNFKKFAIKEYKIPGSQIDGEREFIQRTLRSEFVTAAYGATTSYQVFNEYDNQLKQAVELLPQAKQLALEGARALSKKMTVKQIDQ